MRRAPRGRSCAATWLMPGGRGARPLVRIAGRARRRTTSTAFGDAPRGRLCAPRPWRGWLEGLLPCAGGSGPALRAQ
eukprot:12687440-Alexandrium_andersonii.AAC.1